jgi:predicted DNA-binding transcriptional regulator AlpA
MATTESQRSKRYVRPATAAAKLGISLPSFWRLVKNDPSFPRGVKLGKRCTVFDEDAIDVCLASKQRLAA